MVKNVELIAKLCHEANRAYCQSIGDNSQPTWEEAPQWQKDSAKNGVAFHLEHERYPFESHVNWVAEKVADGWVYGEVKDPEKKTHPCIVPYDELPVEQQAKDYIFKSIVDTFRNQEQTPANEQIEKAFTYHPPKAGQVEVFTEIRESFKELAYTIDRLVPNSREKSVALTNLETANFWANAGVARN